MRLCHDAELPAVLLDLSVLPIRFEPGKHAGEAYQEAVRSCRAK